MSSELRLEKEKYGKKKYAMSVTIFSFSGKMIHQCKMDKTSNKQESIDYHHMLPNNKGVMLLPILPLLPFPSLHHVSLFF